MSEKRKRVLLLLKDGAKEMEDILKTLCTTRQALLPQIKILEKHFLVSHYEDTYELTSIGKILIDDAAPLLNTLEILDLDVDYWGTHNLDFIPVHLLKRISELQKCEIIKTSNADLYDLNKTVMKSSFMSNSHRTLCTFYHPNFPEFFSGLMQNNANVYFVTTPEVFDKFKKQHIENFENLLKNKLFHFYVCSVKMNFLAMVYNDYHLFLRPLKNNGEVDSSYVLCSNPDSLEWGKDLFKHYMKKSIPITEI
ncbi:winged helix-turn-helix domain-containing protein [Methanolobus sp. ZRKC4]